jgi:hydroxymethylpyrimidine pyrophosphatase-like HAD family hydrolase
VRPRLIATDLDGTLLGSDSMISAYSVEVLDALRAMGVHVLAVTARPPRALGPVAGHTSVICLNGALVLSEGTVTDQYPLADAVVRDLARDLRATLPGVSLALERPSGMAAQTGFETHLEPVGDEPRAPLVEDLLDGTTCKFLVRADVPDDVLGAEVRRGLGVRGHAQ